MPHTPTPEQEAAISAASAGSSLMLQAYAGCAKSSTLEMMAPRIGEPSLALAFNKRIADDISKRLPPNFQAKTLNGLGHGAWARRLPQLRLKLDERKTGALITEVSKDMKVRLSAEQWAWSREVMSKAQLAGIVPQSALRHVLDGFEPPQPDTPEAWQEVADEVGVPSEDQSLLIDIAQLALVRDIELALQGTISFDDQIYCPTVLGGAWAKFPTVMVDESQDLSPLNHAMLQHSLRVGGRLIAVGDPLQAIYGFRGADHASMKSLRRLSPAWTDLPLTMTFRCPQEIVLRQQRHAPGFQAAPSNAAGVVEQWTASPDGWTLDRLRQMASKIDTRSIAVLCRNNGPLMSLAFKLLRQGVGVHMLGRDIGKGLAALSKKILPEDSTPRARCADLIQEWEIKESQLAIAGKKEHLLDSISDRAQCLQAVLDSGASDAGQLRALLAQLFAREAGLITLSSIHRAKGLEWDLVLHLDPWRIPSKWSRKAAAQGDDRQLRQEFNLRYVCETRTRNVLVLANLEDFS